jgi:hypothetical protein
MSTPKVLPQLLASTWSVTSRMWLLNGLLGAAGLRFGGRDLDGVELPPKFARVPIPGAQGRSYTSYMH